MEKKTEETKEAAALIHRLNDRNFLFFRGMVQTAAAFFMNPQAQEPPIQQNNAPLRRQP